MTDEVETVAAPTLKTLKLNHDEMTYGVRGRLYPGVPSEWLIIEDENLEDHLEQHAARFAWYGNLHAMALVEEAKSKQELAIVYAQLDKKVRSEAQSASMKLTEKMVENTVLTHPDYCRFQDIYNDKQEQQLLLKNAMDALRIAKDMIIQKAFNHRSEYHGDPSVRAQQMTGR